MYKFSLAGYTLPIAPGKISINSKNTNETMELVNGGEINFIRTPALTEFSFDFLIPWVEYPFANYSQEFKEPEFYVELLRKLKSEKKAFRFAIYRVLPKGKVLFETDEMVSLEEYSLVENAENGFDITASVKLKVFMEHSTLIKEIINNPNGDNLVKTYENRSADKNVPNQYTVQKGDNLWAICKKVLGDGGKYKEIAAINNISNPNLIYAGQVIRFE